MGRIGEVLSILMLDSLAWTFQVWSRMLLGLRLGPSLGTVSERLEELDLSHAFPGEEPSSDLIDGRTRERLFESSSNETLRRASTWAAVLELVVESEIPAYRLPPNTVLTTYGFVRLNGKVQLSIIHYLKPLSAFVARPRPVQLGNWIFPVVIRPWLTLKQGGQSSDGNCWITFLDNGRKRRPGILAALHTVCSIPRGHQPVVGKQVQIWALRNAPRGHLRRASEKIDAAVIEVSDSDMASRAPVPISRSPGYKPVRLLSSHGPVDADVIELVGFVQGKFFFSPGDEPLHPAHLVMNRALAKGDSGCLILDRDAAPHDGEFRPYLLYLGRVNISRGSNTGYGLFLDQARACWDLDFLR